MRDDAETKKLGVFGAELQGLENALPIDPRYRNPKLGALAPIRVVNVVFTAGDGNRGVQTAAFNLPNDDRVIREKGSKRVMLKNVQEAKFEKVLDADLPASRSPPPIERRCQFDAFFTHILMHELMHGLGPHHIGRRHRRRCGRRSRTPTRRSKRPRPTSPGSGRCSSSPTRASSPPRSRGRCTRRSWRRSFRSIRFGITEAHGKGIALQLNYLLDHGAIVVTADGTFSVVDAKIKDAVAALTRDLMTMQARRQTTRRRRSC